MGDTTIVTCAGCATDTEIMTPAEDGWEALTVPDPSQPGKVMRVAGWRILVRCPRCGHLSVFNRED